MGVLSACGGGKPAPAVATVSFTPSRSKLALGSPVVFTYRFDVAPGAVIGADYRVFAHVKTPDGQILWNDDHDLPVATSQWMPGQTIQYAHTRFVPMDPPYLGEAYMEVGLYRPGEDGRLPLAGGEPGDRGDVSRAYVVGTLQLLPPSENIFVIYKTGWHPLETAAEDPTRSWTWTQKSAVLTFDNPRADVTLYLQYAARPDVFGVVPQQVAVVSANHRVATLTADSSQVTLRLLPITAAELGTNDKVELRIDVDRTFVPADLAGGGRDRRELGLQVYQAFIERR